MCDSQTPVMRFVVYLLCSVLHSKSHTVLSCARSCATVYRCRIFVSATFRYVVPRLKCQHEAAICCATNSQQITNGVLPIVLYLRNCLISATVAVGGGGKVHSARRVAERRDDGVTLCDADRVWTCKYV